MWFTCNAFWPKGTAASVSLSAILEFSSAVIPVRLRALVIRLNRSDSVESLKILASMDRSSETV